MFVQARGYRVEYLCTSNPRQPVWRDDPEDEDYASLRLATGRALELASKGPRGHDVRVVDQVGNVAWQYPRPQAA